MRVVGIDTSLTGTGISDGKTTWIVKSTGKADDDLEARHERLVDVRTGIWSHMPLEVPSNVLVVIEQPAYSKMQGHAHDRSGLWWLMVHDLVGSGYTVVEVTPTSLKTYATGKGNASKADMLDASIRRLPDIETGNDDNRVDALWLAAMGLDHVGLPLCDMPVTHRKALDKVRWQ